MKTYEQIMKQWTIVRVRVLGTDYGSSWVRELIWALLRVKNCSRPRPRRRILAATLRSESLSSSSVYSKVCRTRITRLGASGTGFQTLRMMGWSSFGRLSDHCVPKAFPKAFLGVLASNRAGVSKFYFGCFQNATGSSSAPSKAPELRIELAATVFHARGPEIP